MHVSKAGSGIAGREATFERTWKAYMVPALFACREAFAGPCEGVASW